MSLLKNNLGPQPRVLARPDHGVSRKGISANALKVLYRLHRSGYISYLVGGAVRDLLLGGTPKDFDVGTNARPTEIRSLFGNSRIIGRRFRLAHVMFRGEIVEVSTFRAAPGPPESPDEWDDEDGDDFESTEPEPPDPYGTPEEDAQRRDFTINALFYDVSNFSVIDHVGGLKDLDKRVVRTVGEPVSRFEEDPVRMMRALEYAERLSFKLDPATRSAVHECHEGIVEAAPARLSYELMETLRSGHAQGILKKWREFGILKQAFPDIDCDAERISPVLDVVDRRIGMGASFPDASLVGALFLARFMDIVQEIDARESRFSNAELLERTKTMLDEAGANMRLANHTGHLVLHGLYTMTKLRHAPSRGRQVVKISRPDFFPVAWDLFDFAVNIGYFDSETQRSWSRALDRVRSADGSADNSKAAPKKSTKRRGRRRGRNRSKGRRKS